MLRTTVGSILCTLLVSALPAQHGQGEDKHATPRQRTPPDYLSGEEARAAAVFQEVLPSVVTVLTRRTVFTEEGVREQKALGSGVLVSPECHVLTAAHVVEGADTILVRTHDGVLRRAELLFSETSADIAMIRLTPEVTDLAHARLGDSDRLVKRCAGSHPRRHRVGSLGQPDSVQQGGLRSRVRALPLRSSRSRKSPADQEIPDRQNRAPLACCENPDGVRSAAHHRL